MAEVNGYCAPSFEPLRELLSMNVDSGDDVGASIALVHDGELVVDIWAGWTDEARTTPWERDTITNVWSSTKTMVGLMALMLIDRGEFAIGDKVARYWPEFAANGKADIEIRHLLSHTSGLSGWDQPVVVEDLYDWEKSTSMLAAQAPWWEPGTASGYQALDHGHLIGEVMRRITGQKPGEFLAEHVAGPLGADFVIGLDPAQFGRVANVIPPPLATDGLAAPDPASVSFKTFSGPRVSADVAWTEGWRRADIGAANGHGNARSVARIQSAISHGGAVGDVQLVSPATLETIFQEQANGVDLASLTPVRWGVGFGLPLLEARPYIPLGRKCFWGGWGGSSVLNDLDHRFSFAYMMNRMEAGIVGSPRTAGYVTTLYECLEPGVGAVEAASA